jgi:hypothetical protein
MTRLAQIGFLFAALVINTSCSHRWKDTPDTGSQLGQFSGGGGGTLASLVSPKGGWPAEISVIKGHRLSHEGLVEGDQQNLLYMVTGYPDAEDAKSSDLKNSDQQFISTRSWSWQTRGETVTMSLSWDRRTDVVTAAGREFRRTKGNVFVFSVTPNGQVVCRQLPSLSPSASGAEAWRHVQRHCSDDPFLASLRLEIDVP